MPDPDPTNALERIKRQLEAHVAAGLQAIFGLPSLVSQSLNPRAFAPSDGAEASSRAHAVSARYETDYKVAYNSGGAGDNNDNAGRVETLLNQLSGQSTAEHTAAWHMFLEISQYSPFVVQETLGQGPPPPRDLLHLGHGYNLEPMWIDAFEDLLRASSALPMREAGELARELGFRHSGWADILGRTPESSKTLSRFCDMGVTEAYFPIRETDHVSPGTLEAWREFRRKELWTTACSSRSPESSPELGEVWLSSESTLAQLVREAQEKAFKTVDEDALPPETKEKSQCRRTPSATLTTKPAEIEQDLYDWQVSRETEADAPRNGPLASFSWSTSSRATKKENGKTITKETTGNSMGKTVLTTERYVDEQGNSHTIQRSVRKNSRGDETTDGTHVVQSPTGQLWQEPFTSEEKKTVASDSGISKGLTGWFWSW